VAYAVSTEVYEGPFDLLLHLILREQVDLYEISLARIVDAYLTEVERMESLDLDVATEFLLIAATLVDVHEDGVTRPAEPLIYWCGYSGYWPDPFFLVRLTPGRQASLAEIRAALHEIEPRRAVYGVRPLSEMLSESTSQQWLNTLLLSLFAATALALAAMGLYGVMSQLVAVRRREIGVRMALGARAGQILRSVVAQAATVTGAGIVAGMAGASALTRFMTTLVFDITAADPLTFAAVPALLAIVALAAALIPARRAAAVDPMRALRED
jgi:putative ABC transport system permease protein